MVKDKNVKDLPKTGKMREFTFSYRMKRDLRKNGDLYLLALPVFAFYAIFIIAPLFGLVIAFQNYSLVAGISGSQFVGFKNFVTFFKSISFFKVMRNTLAISGATIIFGFPTQIILALLIYELKSRKYSRIVQTVTYMPHFISLVIICGLVKDFTAANGIIGSAIVKLTGLELDMLLQSKMFLPIYVISGIWQETGFASIVFLAALMGIDETLFEAANLDGASRWQKLWNITLPSIMPTILTMLIIKIGNITSVGQEKVLLLYNPLIYETSDVISTFVYRRGLVDKSFGFSTAVGMFNSVLNCSFLLVANSLSKKFNDVSLW